MGQGKLVIAVENGRIGVVRDFKDLNVPEINSLISHLEMHKLDFVNMLRDMIKNGN